jgi:hypothetical protein
MKKIFILGMLCLGGLGGFAQGEEPVTEEKSSAWLTVDMETASVPAVRSRTTTPVRTSAATSSTSTTAATTTTSTPVRRPTPIRTPTPAPAAAPAKPVTTTESFKNTNSKVNRFGKKKS